MKQDWKVLCLYMTEGKTQAAAERALGLNPGTVSQVLEKYGFPKRQGKGFHRGPCCGLYEKFKHRMTKEEFNDEIWRKMQGYNAGNKKSLGQLLEEELAGPVRPKPARVAPAASGSTSGGDDVMGMIAGGIGVIVMIAILFFVFRGCGSERRERRAHESMITSVQQFVGANMGGMSMGQMLDGASFDGVWTTFEEVEPRWFILRDRTVIHVRFSGNSTQGTIIANLTVTDNDRLSGHITVGGVQVGFEEFHRMFFR